MTLEDRKEAENRLRNIMGGEVLTSEEAVRFIGSLRARAAVLCGTAKQTETHNIANRSVLNATLGENLLLVADEVEKQNNTREPIQLFGPFGDLLDQISEEHLDDVEKTMAKYGSHVNEKIEKNLVRNIKKMPSYEKVKSLIDKLPKPLNQYTHEDFAAHPEVLVLSQSIETLMSMEEKRQQSQATNLLVNRIGVELHNCLSDSFGLPDTVKLSVVR